MKTILTNLGTLSQTILAQFSQKLSEKSSIGVNAARTCLRQSPESIIKVKRMLEDKQSLVSLFTHMQEILISSSLDKRVIMDQNRYDHNIN